MKLYSVKEIFLTLQGEGAQVGRVAVFCRFSGCNLWSGREKDRLFAQCRFCDTDFVGTEGTMGGRYSAEQLADLIASAWIPQEKEERYCVLTGGEPLLQVDSTLIKALNKRNFTISVETNGTIKPPEGIDWICVSPKAGCDLKVKNGQELKLVFPQVDAPPENYIDFDFDIFSLQPMDGSFLKDNTNLAISYCFKNPKWRVSLQTHKFIGIR
ncbi:7-carboxy-7-deazaguanine synthase [Candidatus Liberibacter solanacearum]|uniref:7-carboxy-7-deazaguanine synthase n=1 Tax=Candidatus Liberibacter solanacearum TaxID=556287 RepID=A0A1V2N732_9HYPH|nr:7-carboxy-7-deazaguanine synthase [Candidatus Liberibacter solanacearum]ONI58622.1 7-carboxy-7-deazaguanine synthase [Candidatus Liberibacter solanacearum]ONI59540.1 7-carboxy-7-deazaguanine synthase [Candidatus Liberibacter solanacearum]